MPLTHKICEYCNKEFSTEFANTSRKYCSHKCYTDSRITKQEIKCDFCGKLFYRRLSDINVNTMGRFCSLKCSHSFPRGVHYKSKLLETIEIEGHIISRDKTNSEIGIVDRKIHKVVCCSELGVSKISKGWEVHHRDCDKSNNSPDNLVVLTIKDHKHLHRNYGSTALRVLTHKPDLIEEFTKESLTPDLDRFLLQLSVLNQTPESLGSVSNKILLPPEKLTLYEGSECIPKPNPHYKVFLVTSLQGNLRK